MRILLTGFEPFDDSPVNPSEQVVKRLAQRGVEGVELCTAILPVARLEGPQALLQALEQHQPEAALCLGQSGGRARLSIERVAVNLLDYEGADNRGQTSRDEPVNAGGPAAYFATLPVRRLLEAVQAAGVPADLSLSAGSYLCNQVLYTLLHHLAMHQLSIPAGFIHLPYLPEQVAAMQGRGLVPSMALETMAKGIEAVLTELSKSQR